jgi:hypothetical protein
VNTLNKNLFSAFKVLRKITGNSINNCGFFKFVISIRGGHCDYSPWATRNLPTPLIIRKWLLPVLRPYLHGQTGRCSEKHRTIMLPPGV